MKSLTPLVLIALLPGTGTTAEPPKADAPKKAPTAADDFQRLQGTWQIESWEESGKALGASDLKKRGVFFGGNVFMFRRDEKVFQAGAVQLDPSKSPATANFSIKEGEGKDGVMLGIYSLESDALKLCFDPQGQSRPENFKPEAKSGFALITLKKPRPAVEEVVNIVGKYRSELVDAVGKVVIAEAIVEKRGDGYIVTYVLNDKVLFIGTAIRKGDQLSMCWASPGQAGISVYKIEAGPKLVGEYTTLGGIGMTGKETLTPWKKFD